MAVLGVVLAGVAYVGAAAVRAYETLPSVPALLTTGFQDSVVYDRFGHQVAVLHGAQNRIDVPLDQIAPVMQTAIIDTEDHNFYQNPGFDLRSILRAALADLRHGSAVQGASTITEQLAKNLFLQDTGTLTYKFQEFFLGLELAREYSKAQILDMYLNTVYFGAGAYGIAAAANTYFDEPPSKLTLAQASLLAGLPQAPSLYDPYVHFALAKQRQWIVLENMVKYGAITQAQAEAAYHTPLVLKRGATLANTTGNPYPWFVDAVVWDLTKHYHFTTNQIYNGGLRIYTTLDPRVYDIAQNAVTYWMNYNFGPPKSSFPDHQAAVVVMDPHTGEVLAVIGGREPAQAYIGGQNFALTARRSPGSSIKPIIVYTPAIAKGYTQMSVIQDVPAFKRNGQWWPTNDDGYYRGYIDLRDALAISDNNVAVKLLDKIGLQYGFDFAVQKFGLPLSRSNLAQAQLAMAIGGFYQNAPTPLQMAEAYDALANGGVRMQPLFVTRVTNRFGAVLLQNLPHGTPAFSPQVAYIVTQMLERTFYPTALPGLSQETNLPEYATGMNLSPGRPAAGKTGTNTGFVDAWFDGYTPQLLAVVWEGRKDDNPNVPQYTLHGPAYGATAAGPIWRQIIQQASAALGYPPLEFPRPPGIVTVPDVSITSGMLAGPNTPAYDIQSADFIAGTEPTQVGSVHVQEPVVAGNPTELWAPGCGAPLMETFIRPESDWRPGMPLPLDHVHWPPTASCANQPTPPPSPPGPPGPGNTPLGNATIGAAPVPNPFGFLTVPAPGSDLVPLPGRRGRHAGF